MKMSSWCHSCGSNCGHNGKINDESERTEAIDGDAGDQAEEVDPGRGGGGSGVGVSAGSAGMAELSAGRRQRPGASGARFAGQTLQAREAAGADPGAVCGAVSRSEEHTSELPVTP